MLGRIFLNRYQVTRLLGEGGMGRVYLGHQMDLDRQVVIKVMHDHISADSKFRERFERETRLMAKFQHTYAVTLYDASLDGPDGPCIVMEYIRGITLDHLLMRNGRMSPPRVGRLLDQLCEVLQAAHEEGIVHRDLKPANLMVVDPDTPYEKIKVMDFGLALPSKIDRPGRLTNGNGEFAIGTPGYMCPEQVKGDMVDHRGDIYSVGVILYELLTGKLPFDGSSSMEILLAHINNAPPPFAQVGESGWASPAVEQVVLSCLAKRPDDRPATARELADRFAAALEQGDAVDMPGEDSPPDSDPEGGSSVALLREADPHAVVHELEAWMPESIASHKLYGFVQDQGGEILESVPGKIRVLLGGMAARRGQGPLSWFGIGRRNGEIEMELSLSRGGAGRENLLRIMVAMRSPCGKSPADQEWRARCTQIFCDLRGYLLGRTGSVKDAVVS